MNAKVGSDNANFEGAMGKDGSGVMNEYGRCFTEFCLENNCIIDETIFPHKNIHKLTWNSAGGKRFNQIDHIAIKGNWRRSLQDVRVRRGADIYSDHYLLVAIIKFKLKKDRQGNNSMLRD